jgi:hypothetical protein
VRLSLTSDGTDHSTVRENSAYRECRIFLDCSLRRSSEIIVCGFPRRRHWWNRRSQAAALFCKGGLRRVGTAPTLCVLTMRFKFIMKTLVYEYAGLADVHGVSALETQDGWRAADPGLVERVFRHDKNRRRRFQEYLRFGHTGLIMIRGDRWVSYGWCSNPQAPAPPHLPGWASSLGACWIFGCHTHERFRCRGMYKQLLARLTAMVLGKDPLSTVYIDTHAENVPSRRAIVASGFWPCGIFSTYRVWAPVLGPRIIGGRWRREEKHPDLAGVAVPDALDAAAAPVAGGAAYSVRSGDSAAHFD